MLRDSVIKCALCLAVAATCLTVNVRRYPMVGELLAGGEMRAVTYQDDKQLEDREPFSSMASRWYKAARNSFTKKPADVEQTEEATTPTPPTLPLPTPTTTLPPLPPLVLQVSQPVPAVASRYTESISPTFPTSPAALADGAWLPPEL